MELATYLKSIIAYKFNYAKNTGANTKLRASLLLGCSSNKGDKDMQKLRSINKIYLMLAFTLIVSITSIALGNTKIAYSICLIAGIIVVLDISARIVQDIIHKLAHKQ